MWSNCLPWRRSTSLFVVISGLLLVAMSLLFGLVSGNGEAFHLQAADAPPAVAPANSAPAITPAAANSAPISSKVDFNRQVRSILSDACFNCHGPDDKKREAGLRLDQKASAFAAHDSGKTIVPGDRKSSELWKRITSTKPDEHMPPKKAGKTLSPQQIELIGRWIDEGADWKEHWSFVPPRQHAPPLVKNRGWSRSPLDDFILARLEQEGLAPSPEADKPTLIRRVTLDLTGLPPTPEETAAFLADSRPDAYERLVDRLLASPRYGERMAAPWLDFARYADSNGYQSDSSRQMWPWRDWVIAAFNRNMPFDEFTVEQLGGDLLPNPTRSQQIATGFNRNHRINGEGGSIAEEWRIEYVIDRVETTGQTWLALSVGCGRCHDHKYDPLTQKEFYQLFAFFNNVPESGLLSKGDGKNTDPAIPALGPERDAQWAHLDAAAKQAEKNVAAQVARLPELLAAWEPRFLAEQGEASSAWKQLEPTSVVSSGGATLTKQSDGSYLAGGKNPDHDVYTITAPLPAGQFTAVLLEALPDDSLPNQSLGRYSNGNFVLTEIETEITAPGLLKPEKARFAKAQATYSQPDWDVGLVLSRNKSKGWAVDGNDPTKRIARKAMFLVDKPLVAPENGQIKITLKHEAIQGHNIGRFRLSVTGLPLARIKLDGKLVPPNIHKIIATPLAKRTPQQRTELEKFFRQTADSPLQEADVALATAKKNLADYQEGAGNVMVMQEMEKPRPTHILVRGQYDKPGELVTAGLPSALPPLPAGAPLNRLGLARWLVDPSHPLTARVWVNRAWEKFFGQGIVRTTENLGSQGEWPSHPELLDYLAVSFRESLWDMKQLQRQIVTSSTYRQASRASANLLARDPENRLLSRGPRFRLPGEVLRDQALSVSGLLVEHTGGPSVRPYMPAGVWDETSVYGDLRNYQHDKNAGLYRRTLYTIWKRTAAPPTMLLFDAPSREVCTVKRSCTNTPLQALALLNEVTYVEAARKLGERMILEGGKTPPERLAYGFRLVASRSPTDDELKILTTGLAADLARFQQRPVDAQKLLAQGDSPSAAVVNPAELAAYALTGNILLNLDEVVTRE